MRRSLGPAGKVRLAAAVLLVGAGITRATLAHPPLTPPKLIAEPPVAWPAGHALPNDLIIPVVLTIDATGAVERAELEAGVGEPFDSSALQAARLFRFSPARDSTGPRAAKLRALVRFRAASAAVLSAQRAATRTPAAKPRAPTSAVTRAPPPGRSSAAPKDGKLEVEVRGVAPARSASEALLDKPLLKAAPHKNASELLLVVPGVSVSQHSGEGKAHQIFFRGFDAVHGQDVELWAAGAPINDVSNIHGQGYADLHFLIPEVIEEIQSLPGTYDPAQGDFAVAGSLRFKLGYDEPGVTAKASLGTFGTRRYFLAYHPRPASRETFAAFELYKTDGFGPARAARHGSAIGQATYQLGNGVTGRVMASTYAGRFDSAGVLRLDSVESGELDRFATYDPKQGGYSARSQLVAEISQRAPSATGRQPDRWSLSPYLVLRSLKLRSNFTGVLTSPEGDSIQQLNDATTLGLTGSYQHPLRCFSDQDTLAAGISLRSDMIEQSQHRLSTLTDRVTDDALSPGVAADVRASNAAAYVDSSLRLVPRLTLRAGLRADALSYLTLDRGGTSAGQTRSAAGGQLSKRATLDYALLPGLNALLSYGEGFRSPQARSLGDGETTPFTRVVSSELGVRYRSARRFQAALAVFYTQLSDDLAFDQSSARNELVPGTRRTGVAASIKALPTPWLVSNSSATYTRAVFDRDGLEVRSGDSLPYVPQIVLRSDLALTPNLGTVFNETLRSHFGTGLTYLGSRPLPYAEFGHDSFLVDLSAEFRLGPVETGVEIFNVLDAAWYDGEFVYASQFSGAASLIPIRHVTTGPPRTLLWSLTLFL